MIKLTGQIGREEFNKRLKSARPKVLKSLAEDFTKVLRIPVNKDQKNKNLRKTLEGLYFRDRSLLNEDSIDKDKVNGKDYFDVRCLINCPFTTKNSFYDTYMAMIYPFELNKNIKRSDIYKRVEEYKKYHDQKFSKKEIYRIIQWAGQHKVGKKSIVETTKPTMKFRKIKEWDNFEAKL
ncbi:MAG: hypothetical protein K9K32_00215 [Halanaerobiales bacterium]|nr:hypothetical protein [Halanaerobiales bacterium]